MAHFVFEGSTGFAWRMGPYFRRFPGATPTCPLATPRREDVNA